MVTQVKNCIKCNKPIPIQRIQLGYNTHCVACAETERYGCVNIVNHKTGNTVQALPKELAAAINKLGDRKRFGTILRGGSKSGNIYNPKNIKFGGCRKTFIGSPQSFDKVGTKVADIVQFEKDYNKAIAYLDAQLNNYTINKTQYAKIKQIIQILTKVI